MIGRERRTAVVLFTDVLVSVRRVGPVAEVRIVKKAAPGDEDLDLRTLVGRAGEEFLDDEEIRRRKKPPPSAAVCLLHGRIQDILAAMPGVVEGISYHIAGETGGTSEVELTPERGDAGVSGLGALLGRQAALGAVLTLGGAAFLSWYAFGAFRRARKPSRLDATGTSASIALGMTLRTAVGFTFLNPHVYLDTVLFLGTIGASRPVCERPSFLAGAALASAVWFLILGYGARLLSPLFARADAWRVLDGAVALTMTVLAVVLVRQGFSNLP